MFKSLIGNAFDSSVSNSEDAAADATAAEDVGLDGARDASSAPPEQTTAATQNAADQYEAMQARKNSAAPQNVADQETAVQTPQPRIRFRATTQNAAPADRDTAPQNAAVQEGASTT